MTKKTKRVEFRQRTVRAQELRKPKPEPAELLALGPT
jgi:hypothetical protein